MEEITLFSTVYEFFLGKITDDMYVSLGQEDAYADMEQMLLEGVNKFSFPKINLRNYDLSYADDYNLSKGKFNVVLGIGELDILTDYMVISWVKRQIAHCRLVEMNYSGADAKVLNTKSQIEALTGMSNFFTKEVAKKVRLYSNTTVDEDGMSRHSILALSGKHVIR